MTSLRTMLSILAASMSRTEAEVHHHRRVTCLHPPQRRRSDAIEVEARVVEDEREDGQ